MSLCRFFTFSVFLQLELDVGDFFFSGVNLRRLQIGENNFKFLHKQLVQLEMFHKQGSCCSVSRPVHGSWLVRLSSDLAVATLHGDFKVLQQYYLSLLLESKPPLSLTIRKQQIRKFL